MKRGKQYRENALKIEAEKAYEIDEALSLVKEVSYVGFDESLEVHFNLGIDPRHADQMIRGTLRLPHGSGKKMRIVVVAPEDKETVLKAAGADEVGEQALLDKIKGGWLDFDVLLTSPNMMAKLARLGKLLGGRGLMPSPKNGTVSTDLEKAVKEIKAGKVEYRNDKAGIIHLVIGKLSFSELQLKENYETVLSVIKKAKPAKSKGVYMKSITLASSMGPGVNISIPN